MKKPITALVAAGVLGFASVATAQPAHAMDPWTAAAWFVGGLSVGAAVVAPSYGYAYGYRAPYPYAYTPAYAPQYCYATTIRRAGVWREAQVCY